MGGRFRWSGTVARRVSAGSALTLAGVRSVLPETGVAAVEELVPVVLSAVINTGSFGPALAFLLNAAFFFAVFTTLVPELYPDSMGSARETVVFRLSVGAVGAITAVPLYYALSDVTPPLEWPPALGLGVAAGLSVVVFWDWSRRNVGIDSPSDLFARILVAESAESPDDALPPWLEGVNERVELIAGVLIVGAPAYLAGMLGGVLGTFFPALELLLVVGLVSARFDSVLPTPLRRRLDKGRSVETRAYDSLSSSIRHGRGIAGYASCLFGFILGALPLAVGLGGYGQFANNAAHEWEVAVGVGVNALSGGVSPVVLPRFLVDAVAATVFLVSLPLLTAYYSWYWYRQLRRMPTALRYADAVSLTDRTLPPVGRPPFALVPATVLFVLTMVYDRWYAFGIDQWVGETVLAVVGPVLLVTLAVGVRRSLRTPRLYPSRDGIVTMTALSVSCAGFYVVWFAFDSSQSGLVVFIPVVAILTYYFKNIVEFAATLSPESNTILVFAPLAPLSLFWLPAVPFDWRVAAFFVTLVPLFGYASLAKRYED
ncbi:hypothetical protein [Natronomonas gomsonensis]|uniref:hypothetical protein n=1 Tax=Natronomonas gomsonensis TaxID=1046043 RepID=UPI0015BADE23|nr:hypothetical protein [Natronomonas gomsonensis]